MENGCDKKLTDSAIFGKWYHFIINHYKNILKKNNRLKDLSVKYLLKISEIIKTKFIKLSLLDYQ